MKTHLDYLLQSHHGKQPKTITEPQEPQIPIQQSRSSAQLVTGFFFASEQNSLI